MGNQQEDKNEPGCEPDDDRQEPDTEDLREPDTRSVHEPDTLGDWEPSEDGSPGILSSPERYENPWDKGKK